MVEKVETIDLVKRLENLTVLYRKVAELYKFDRKGLEKILSKVFGFRIKKYTVKRYVEYYTDCIFLEFYNDKDRNNFYEKYKNEFNLRVIDYYENPFIEIYYSLNEDEKGGLILKSIVEEVIKFINKTFSEVPSDVVNRKNPSVFKLLVMLKLKGVEKEKVDYVKYETEKGIKDIVTKLEEYIDFYHDNARLIVISFYDSLEKIESVLKSIKAKRIYLGKILTEIFNIEIPKARLNNSKIILYFDDDNKIKEFKNKYKNQFLTYTNGKRNRITISFRFRNLLFSEKVYYSYELLQKITNALN